MSWSWSGHAVTVADEMVSGEAAAGSVEAARQARARTAATNRTPGESRGEEGPGWLSRRPRRSSGSGCGRCR